MTLRYYQADVLDRVFAEYNSGKQSVCAVMPTGSGKTTVGSEAVIRKLSMRGASAVWLAPLKELVEQAKKYFPTSIDVVCVDETTDLQETIFPRLHISTVQSLAKRKHRPRAKFVVFDEGQYFYGTEEWSALADYYKAQGAEILSMTATPSRADGSPLSGLADSLVVGPSIKELTEKKYLVPCDVYSPTNDDRFIFTPDPIYAYNKYASGSKAVVFCSTVDEAKDLASDFSSHGISAGFAHSGDRRAVDLHRDGTIKVLCNVYLLSFGYDDPSIETVILNRKCGNVSTLMQMVGRALRPSKGKERARFIDIFGNIHQPGFGRPDDERTFSLDSNPINHRGANRLEPGIDFNVISA
jgi:superfamily II DNA or RNA helicase